MSSEALFIEKAATFAMAHPVATVAIVAVAATTYLVKEYIQSKNHDEDRSVNTTNERGRTRQS